MPAIFRRVSRGRLQGSQYLDHPLQSDPKFVQDAQANTRLESKKVSPRGEGFLTGMPRNFLGNELLVAPIAVVEVDRVSVL